MKTKGKKEITTSLKTSKKEKKNFSKREKILFVIILILLLLLLLFSCPWFRRKLDQFFQSGGDMVEKVTNKDKNSDQKSDDKKIDRDEKNQADKDNKQETNNKNTNGSSISSDSNQGGFTGSNQNGSGNHGSSGSGNNDTSGGNDSSLEPTPIPVSPIATFQLVSWEQSSVSMYQAPSSTTITFHGSLSAKEPLPSQGIHTGYYVQFMVIAPQNYTASTLSNMHIVTATAEYNKQIDGYVNGLPFFYITQEIRPGMIVPLTINWGDGQVVNYTLSFQIETI